MCVFFRVQVSNGEDSRSNSLRLASLWQQEAYTLIARDLLGNLID